MPTLRRAASFCFNLIDRSTHLLRAPGSLFIDVFVRGNYTTDSSAMVVGFLGEFAEARHVTRNCSFHPHSPLLSFRDLSFLPSPGGGGGRQRDGRGGAALAGGARVGRGEREAVGGAERGGRPLRDAGSPRV